MKVKDLAVPDRNYPDGTVTLPVYSYSASSETAGLVGNSFGLRKKIKAFFCEKNLTEPAALKIRQQIAFINSKLGKVGESKTITLPVSYTGSYNAGALNRVGLGSADLNLSRIDLTVEKTEVEKTEVEKTEATKTGYDFIITGGAVWGEVKDIFDYNYFTGTDTTIEHDEAKGKACETKLLIKKHRATASGATIQCGFGRAGIKAGAGNVGSVVIELSNNRFTFGTPIQIRVKDNLCLNPDPSKPSCQ